MEVAQESLNEVNDDAELLKRIITGDICVFDHFGRFLPFAANSADCRVDSAV